MGPATFAGQVPRPRIGVRRGCVPGEWARAGGFRPRYPFPLRRPFARRRRAARPRQRAQTGQLHHGGREERRDSRPRAVVGIAGKPGAEAHRAIAGDAIRPCVGLSVCWSDVWSCVGVRVCWCESVLVCSCRTFVARSARPITFPVLIRNGAIGATTRTHSHTNTLPTNTRSDQYTAAILSSRDLCCTASVTPLRGNGYNGGLALQSRLGPGEEGAGVRQLASKPLHT